MSKSQVLIKAQKLRGPKPCPTGKGCIIILLGKDIKKLQGNNMTEDPKQQYDHIQKYPCGPQHVMAWLS